MDVGWHYRLIILAILLFLSAFFSGSEVSLFSLDKKKLKDLQKEKKFTSKYILNLIEYPRRLLVTILLGNNFINVAASILAVTLALDFASIYGWEIELVLMIQIVLLTILILIFGEIIPKVWASKYPLEFSRIISIPLYWVGVLIYPVAKVLTEIIRYFTEKFKLQKNRTALSIEEIPDLADISMEKGSIEEDEHDLISGLVSFKSVTVREIMTPRVDIVAVSLDTSFDELLNIIVESGHSRIPLYRDNLDNIVGIIYAKDLLPFVSKKNEIKESINLRNISRETIFVPETKFINKLMHEFQSKNLHLGIVVDEYGGTSGLVSLEDILEEIVGEIRDEYDNEEEEINKIDANKFIVLGKTPIEELNEFFDHKFSSEDDDYDTVAGFIYNHAGTIPSENYQFVYDNYKFTVQEVVNNRINKIIIERLKQNEDKE